MKFKMTKVRDTISDDLSRLQKVYEQLPEVALEAWKKNTPKDTGNARNKTRLQNDVIVANYDYAQRLDKGYSKKSPRGMSKPTEEEIIRYLNLRIR